MAILENHTQTEEINHLNKSWWQKLVNFLAMMSEAANIGIVIEMISKWLPVLHTVAGGIFPIISALADVLIYGFKELIQFVRFIGREFFNVQFEEEKFGRHKWQRIGNFLCLSLFMLAILAFLGVLVSSPFGLTLAWSLALGGLSVVGYFDYYNQTRLAERKWQENCKTYGPESIQSKNAHQQFIAQQNSYRLFMALLVGLACLLICGSAAVFAPPALVPVLFIISKIASGYLGIIAVSRFTNWLWSNHLKNKQHTEEKPEAKNNSVNTYQIEHSLAIADETDSESENTSEDDMSSCDEAELTRDCRSSSSDSTFFSPANDTGDSSISDECDGTNEAVVNLVG